MSAVFHPWQIREFREGSDGIPSSGRTDATGETWACWSVSPSPATLARLLLVSSDVRSRAQASPIGLTGRPRDSPRWPSIRASLKKPLSKRHSVGSTEKVVGVLRILPTREHPFGIVVCQKRRNSNVRLRLISRSVPGRYRFDQIIWR